MNRLLRAFYLGIALLASAPALVHGQNVPTGTPPPSAPPPRSSTELEKLVSPIALYPDPLIATILPAAAYPLEIVQAARLMKDPGKISQVESQPWDKNVKELAKIPSVLTMMDADLEWTTALGQAFINQPQGVMDAIQTMRLKAEQLGNLKTTPQQIVVVTNAVVEKTYQTQIVYVTNTVVQIQPANPQVVYVPQYTTTVYSSPPPSSSSSSDAAATLLSFGAGIALGAVIANNCDWHYGGVYWGPPPTVIVRPGYPPYYPPPPGYRPPPYYPPPGYRPPPPGSRPPGVPPPGYRPPGPYAATTGATQRWQPDSARLNSSGAGSVSNTSLQNRGWSTAQPGSGMGGAGNRASQLPATPAVGTSPRPSPSTAQPPGSAGVRSTGPGSQPAARPASNESAFSGFSRTDGNSSRDFSNRGATSRGSGGSGIRSAGGRGGGGGGGRGRR